MKASEIISRAARTAADVQKARWNNAEYVDYINDGQALIAEAIPEASSIVATMKLAAGTKQVIPYGGGANLNRGIGGSALPSGNTFLRVIRNAGSDGSTPGFAVRATTLDVLDYTVPDWHVAPRMSCKRVEMAAPDTTTKRGFFVYPGPLAADNTHVDIAYSVVPAKITESDLGLGAGEPELALGDEFLGALTDYVLFRVYAKDGDDTSALRRSAGHFTAFSNAIALIKGAPQA